MTKPDATEFPYAFEARVARWSRLFGVTAAPASVTVGEGQFEARFGPWRMRTPLTNVVSATVTGPYRAWMVAGPARLSLSDRGLTFATSTGPGVCVGFRDPVPGIDAFGVIKHPSLTVTVADAAALVDALGPLPDAVPLRPARPSGTIAGAMGALRSWTGRTRSVTIEEREVDHVDIPSDAFAPRDHGQPLQAGVGSTFHRSYRTTVTGATMSADHAMARIQADPNAIASPTLAPFVKDRGSFSTMAKGDRYTVETAGPWSGPVEVVAVGPLSFRLATLDGHMEAGLIDFRVEPGDDSMAFVIESWARSGDRAFDALYDKVGVGKAMQSEMWVVAGERFAEMTGGTPAGPVQIDEERA